MKVFVLMGEVSYEGFVFLGVFSSAEKAENAKLEYLKNKNSIFDNYDIEEAELDEFNPA